MGRRRALRQLFSDVGGGNGGVDADAAPGRGVGQ